MDPGDNAVERSGYHKLGECGFNGTGGVSGEVLGQGMCLADGLLIPKGNAKDFCVIGLIEVLWKATTRIIKQRLTVEMS